MRCEEVLNQLNARADGELGADEAAGLEAHLADCSACRSAAEGLEAIDAELRRAFVPRREAAARLAESAAAMVRASGGGVGVASAAPRLAWGQILAALAAGFLLAVALLRPWQPKTVAISAEPIARLAVASGPVEVQAASQGDVFTCAPSAPIARDSIVRTGPTERCEITLDNGNALRLDCNTEVTLHDREVVKVSRGRVWSTSQAGRKGVEIQAAGGTIVAKDAAQLAVACEGDAVRLIVVDGAVNVQTGGKSTEVGPGKQVRITQGKVEADPRRGDALLETAWVNSVLALGGPAHPELAERVRGLLAKVGAAKLSLLYEDELRRLGDAGVPPLLAYLDSTRDSANVAQRATAARIVADVAQSRWIGDLIAMLTDANSEVRFHAARGLERLTGRDQGLQAQAWRSAPWASCEPPHQKWLAWWAANRDRYPAARRDVEAPKSPPF
jgi:ferric-dicitrate binding protein FerR (iron transport regulator)